MERVLWAKNNALKYDKTIKKHLDLSVKYTFSRLTQISSIKTCYHQFSVNNIKKIYRDFN